MKQDLSFPLELLELPPSDEVPLGSARAGNNFAANFDAARHSTTVQW